MKEDSFVQPERIKRVWKCKKCSPADGSVRLQQVSYGHVENGKFVVDEKTDFACVNCHAVYSEEDLKA